jgi:hypothetical protein
MTRRQIVALREKLGMTQRRLAEEIGSTPAPGTLHNSPVAEYRSAHGAA